MTPKQVSVRYRSQAGTAKPLYLSNDEVREVAADVRRQLQPAADGCRLTAETLLQIQTVRANDACLEVCWSTDYPVTNERGDPVLGVCEYEHCGLPDTALISVNPELTGDNKGLRLGTLAHELGHAIFDAPGWRMISCQSGLPGLCGEPIHRVFRTVTADEDHLSGPAPKAGERQFDEWRANEFMGALLVPRDLLAGRLQNHAEAIDIPLEAEPGQGAMLFSQGVKRIAAEIDRRRYAFKMAVLLNSLAEDFGVSLKFIRVRLLRYGLVTDAQLGL